MRALILPALLAIAWIAGCDEGSNTLAPDAPQAVITAVVKEIPDEHIVPDGLPDIQLIRSEALLRFEEHQATISSPGSEMNIIVPDPARGIFTCQDGIDAALPGATVTVLPASVVEDVILWVPDVVFRTAGTVDLHGSLFVFADRVTIAGFNVLRPSSPSSISGIYVADVEGVRILANSLAGWTARALCLDGSQGTLVENNGFSDGSLAAHLLAAHGSVLSDNIFHDIQFAVCAQQSGAILLRDNVMDPVGYGITLDRGIGGAVENNTVVADHTTISLVDSREYVVSNNRLTAGNCGVKLERSHDNEVSDNKILYGRCDGLSLSNSDGNRILRNDAGGTGADGVHLMGASAGNSVVGTVAIGHDDRGIALDLDTHDNVVTASRTSGNAGCDIVNYGTDNTFFDNDADCTYGL